MQRPDHEMLTCAPFYARILRDISCTAPTAEIVEHLCWENMEQSRQLIHYLASGIHAAMYDGLLPFFEVLGPLLNISDSLSPERVNVGMAAFTKEMIDGTEYKNASTHRMAFLEAMAHKNPLCCDWLYQSRDRWLLEFLVMPISDQVREVAERLVQKVCGQSPDHVHNLLISLMKLLPNVRRYGGAEHHQTKKVEDLMYGVNVWRLTGYLRLLHKCFESCPDQTNLFIKYYAEFWSLWDVINAAQLECDENKKELVSLVKFLLQNEQNLEYLCKDTTRTNRLLDFYISLRGIEKSISYNNQAQAMFYELILLVAQKNAYFLGRLMQHQNWSWAMRYIVLESDVYNMISPVVLKIMELCCAQDNPEFRRQWIEKALTFREKMQLAPTNHLLLHDMLLVTAKDAQIFAEHGGMEFLTAFFELRADAATISQPAETDVTILWHCANVIGHWVQIVESLPVAHRDVLLGRWPSRRNVVASLHALVNVIAVGGFRVKFCVLLQQLGLLDSICLETILTAMDADKLSPTRPLLEIQQRAVSDEPADAAAEEFLQAYYAMMLKLIDHALHQAKEHVVDAALRLALSCVIETIQYPSVNQAFVKIICEIFAERLNSTVLERMEPMALLERVAEAIITQQDLVNDENWRAMLTSVIPRVMPRIAPAIQQQITSVWEQQRPHAP